MAFCSWFGGEKYKDHFEHGVYACSECRHPLFLSEAKYAHHTPWPAFTKPVAADSLKRRKESATAFKVLPGVYACSECGHALFRSSAKYEHHTPWPAFTEPVSADSLTKRRETEPTETRCPALKVLCGKCGNGLGHEFIGDGPKGGSRF